MKIHGGIFLPKHQFLIIPRFTLINNFHCNLLLSQRKCFSFSSLFPSLIYDLSYYCCLCLNKLFRIFLCCSFLLSWSTNEMNFCPITSQVQARFPFNLAFDFDVWWKLIKIIFVGIRKQKGKKNRIRRERCFSW